MLSPVLFTASVIDIQINTRNKNKVTVNQSKELSEFKQKITDFYANNFTPCKDIQLGSIYISKDNNEFHRCIVVEEM